MGRRWRPFFFPPIKLPIPVSIHDNENARDSTRNRPRAIDNMGSTGCVSEYIAVPFLMDASPRFGNFSNR